MVLMLSACGTGTSLIDYRSRPVRQVLREYQQSREQIRTLTSSASMILNAERNGKLESAEIRAEIAWNQSDSLAIDLNYSVFEINVSKVVIGHRHYVFTSRTEDSDIFLQGLIEDDYLNAVLKIDIPLNTWGRRLFLNEFDIDTTRMVYDILTDGRLYIESGDTRIWFRRDAVYPEKVEIMQEGRVRFRFTTHGQIAEVTPFIPAEVVFFDPLARSELIIRHKAVRLNQPLPKDFFLVKIPTTLEQIIYD